MTPIEEDRLPLREKVKTVKWWRERSLEFVFAAVVFMGITTVLNHQRVEEKLSAPAEEFFRVNELFVPDHSRGSNPLLIFDRQVLQDFVGFRIATVQKREYEPTGNPYYPACTGSGTSKYTASDEPLDPNVRWSWFFGRTCAVSSGQYRIEVSYDLQIPGYPMKRVSVLSNLFTVR